MGIAVPVADGHGWVLLATLLVVGSAVALRSARAPGSAGVHLAKSSASTSAKALNSRALPEGSWKNMVRCSPGKPSKRT